MVYLRCCKATHMQQCHQEDRPPLDRIAKRVDVDRGEGDTFPTKRESAQRTVDLFSIVVEEERALGEELRECTEYGPRRQEDQHDPRTLQKCEDGILLITRKDDFCAA